METSLCVRKAIKNDSKNVNKNSLSFTFCSIFYLLTFSTEKIARWPLVFKTDFYVIFYNDQLMKILRNFIDKFLLYHTSFKNNFYAIFLKTTHIQQLSITPQQSPFSLIGKHPHNINTDILFKAFSLQSPLLQVLSLCKLSMNGASFFSFTWV